MQKSISDESQNANVSDQVLAATLISLISLLLTTVLYTCFFLSPLFSLVLNATILILYLVGYGLLTWNIYGTLGHSCSRANWASDDGMMICRTYKAFYSFEVFGLLAQIALIVLDVRSRHTQIRLGKYKNMGDVAGAKGANTVKLNDLHPRSVDSRPGMHGHAESQDSIPYAIGNYNDSHTRLRDNAGDMGYGHGPPVRMEDFRQDSSTSGYSYNSWAPQTGHANNGYGYAPQR